MNIYSIGLDVVALVLLLACAFYYAKRGFFASVVGFLGTLLSLVGSFFAAQWISPILFNSLFRSGMEQKVEELLNQTGVQTVGDVLKNMFGFLPQSITDSIGASFGDSIAANTPGAAALVVEKAIMPLVVPLITVIVFLVLFLILRVLIGFLSKLLTGVNKIPLLGTGNRILGFAAGICIGALYILLILCVLWGVDAVYGGQALAPEYFGRSIVYRLTAPWNIFNG